MRMIGVSVTAVLVAVTACTTQPSDIASRTKIVDEMTAYQRSQPSLPTPLSGESLGFVEDGAITLLMNQSLAFAQGRDQCDRKPVERIVTSPRRERKCLKGGLYGCLTYDTNYGEAQPPCEKTSLFDAAMCIRRADPNLPTVSYRYASDCYKTAASSYASGEIAVYAVNKNSTAQNVQVNGWREIGTISLSPTRKSQTVQLTDQAKPGECLVLADRDRHVLVVRSGSVGSASQFFATPRMQAQRVMAKLQEDAVRKQQALEKLKAEIDDAKEAVLTNASWRDNSCTIPAMAALPPEPPGLLSDAEARGQAQGYCAFVLMSQLNSPDRVIEATLAEQELAYIRQFKRFKNDPTNIDACAERSYRYPSERVTRLRGGIEPGRAAFDRGGDLVDSIVAIFEATTMTKQEQNAEIVTLLGNCTATAANACTAPRRAWQAEVERIRNAPQQLAVQCQRDVQRVRDATAQLRQAEEYAEMAKGKLAATKLTVAPGQITLADASCTLE